MRMTRKKIIAALGVAVLVIALGSAAFSYWTSTGNGSGSASTTPGANDLTYVQSPDPLDAMYPGDSEQDFSVTVTNNSTTQSEFVNDISVYITTNKAGCTGADFLINGDPATSTAGTAVALTGFTAQDLAASGGNASTGTNTVQFNNTGAPQNSCKDAQVTLNYTSS